MKSALIGITSAVTLSLAVQWHVLFHAGGATLKEVHFADSLQGWTMASKNLFHTTDRGRTWDIERGLGDPDFKGLAVTDSGHVFASYSVMYYPHYMDWYVWIDEGVHGHWTNRYFKYETSTTYTGYAARLTILDTLHLWHLWHGNLAVRTKDGGGLWEYFGDGPGGYYDASFTDTVTGWAAWDLVWKTTNAGDSWQVLTADVGARRIQMFDTLNGWVLSTSGLMHTTDGGDSWTTVVAESGLKAMRFVDPSNGVAVGSGGLILRTTDSGNTWQTDTAETSLDLYAVWVVDSVHAWAAGDSGVVLGMGDWALPGIEEQRRLSNPPRLVGVWPNPCRGTLWVQCRGGTGSVVVYDDCGRPVVSAQCTPARAEKLELRGLPVGVYFARVLSSPQAGVRFVLLR